MGTGTNSRWDLKCYHPLYSPDLITRFWANECWVGRNLDMKWRCTWTVHRWLGKQPASFIASAIQKHVGWWDNVWIWTLCWKMKDWFRCLNAWHLFVALVHFCRFFSNIFYKRAVKEYKYCTDWLQLKSQSWSCHRKDFSEYSLPVKYGNFHT